MTTDSPGLPSGKLSVIQDRVHGVPDLAVEVVSSVASERDLIVKRDLYARNGIGEYWIVDGETRSVDVLVLDGSAYREEGYCEEADSLVSPTLPGLFLPPGRFWEGEVP